MNRTQQLAFSRPCYEAEDTLASPHWGVQLGKQPFSLTLSLNVGLE